MAISSGIILLGRCKSLYFFIQTICLGYLTFCHFSGKGTSRYSKKGILLHYLRGHSTLIGRKMKLFLKIFFSVNTTYNGIIFLYLLSYSYIIEIILRFF